MRGTLVVCAELESLSREAARRVVTAVPAQEAQPFRLALAGGSTPRRLYELLASPEFAPLLPWANMHFFWGDERLVPADHPNSNYRLAWESLLQKVPVPRENIHPVLTSASPQEAAHTYQQTLREHFGQRRGVPRFDLVLLGLGADGHTASLFPGAAALEEKERLAVAHLPDDGPARVTLTLPVLNRAQRVFFLAYGDSKAAALHAALEGKGRLPAQRVAPAKGELVWLVDSAAASRLQRVRVEPPMVGEPKS